MKLSAGGAVVAAAVLMVGSMGLGEAVASAKAKQHRHPSATFTMYANVDAEGDLGSNYLAKKVTFNADDNTYQVKFAKRVGTCAAVAQGGKAGGPDGVNPDVSEVTNVGNYKTTKTLRVAFIEVINGNPQIPQPFMLTVTCRYTN
jgi:hypothetical protein